MTLGGWYGACEKWGRDWSGDSRATMTAPIRKPSSNRPRLRPADRRTTDRLARGRAGRRAASGIQPYLGGTPTALIAEGTLGSRSLAFLLRDLLDRETEGTLNLVDERGKRHEIDLTCGVPVALRSDVTIEPLTTTLVRLGLLTIEHRKRLGRFNGTDRQLGRHIVEQRLISPSELHGASCHRLLLKIERLLSMGEQTRFSLRRQTVVVDESTPCNVLALLMRGFRRLAHTDRAADVLDHLANDELALHPLADLRFLGLTDTERNVVEGLGAAAATLEELIDLGVGPPPVVRAAVYALAELRYLDLGRTAPPVAVPSDEHLTAGRLSEPGHAPVERALVASPLYDECDVRRRLDQMDHQSHFEMLGVDAGADGRAVRQAHMRELYVWHPDRLPAHLAHLRPEIARLCVRLGEACRVLTNPDMRADYVAGLRESCPDSLREPDVDHLFARAEIAFRRREVDEAEGLLVRICSVDRHHLDARALLAWLRAEQHTPPRLRIGQTSALYAESLEILDAVVREDPNLEKARYWRGQLLKRSGFLREAYTEFKAVVSLNPRNVGAEREVRLFEAKQTRLDEPTWRRWLSTRRHTES